MKKVIFEVTEDHIETGLRGYPVGFCNTSRVDPEKGLYYLEYPIGSLADKDPEEVICLLLEKNMPDAKSIAVFKDVLQKRAPVSQKVIDGIRKLPREGHPMKLFCAALLLLGMHESEDKYPDDCINVIAKIPTIAAEVINHHAGVPSNPSNPSLGYMENFVHMLGMKDLDPAFTKFMRLFDILHFDHGGGNLSTFVGKAVASGLEDMYGSLCSAMCALAGPRHGKANQDCLSFIQEIYDELGDGATGDQVEQLIRDRLAGGGLVFGFGHAVLRSEDARAIVLREFAEANFADHPLVKLVCYVRERGIKVLSENPKISCPFPNVDLMSGVGLFAAKFDNPEYYTVLFGMSRCVGIALQIVHERMEARGGKGVPIYRPKYIFKP